MALTGGGEYREGLRPVFSIGTHSQPSAVFRMQPTFLVYTSPFPSNVLPSELSHFHLMMVLVELEHLWWLSSIRGGEYGQEYYH